MDEPTIRFRVPEATLQAAAALFADGERNAPVARALGLSPTTVAKIRRVWETQAAPESEAQVAPEPEPEPEPEAQVAPEPEPEPEPDAEVAPRRPMAQAEQVITLLATENPKRAGSASFARFALYRDGMAVSEYLEAGGRRSDLWWDSDRGFITLGG